MNYGKIYFSVGEQEIINSLQEHFKCSLIEAIDYVVKQKRETATLLKRQGRIDIAEQLLKEIGDI